MLRIFIIIFLALHSFTSDAHPAYHMSRIATLKAQFYSRYVAQVAKNIKKSNVKADTAAQIYIRHKQHIVTRIEKELKSLQMLYPSFFFGSQKNNENTNKTDNYESINQRSLPFKCIIRPTSSHDSLFESIQTQALQSAQLHNEYSVHSDFASGLVIIQCKTAQVRDAFITNFLNSQPIAKTFSADLRAFPFEILVADATDDQTNPTNVQRVQTTLERRNVAHLNVGVYYNDSSARYAQTLADSFKLFTADGQETIRKIKHVAEYLVNHMSNVCNSIHQGNLAHAHTLLKQLSIPPMPVELRYLYVATRRCRNQLIHCIHHHSTDKSHSKGSLKQCHEIDLHQVASIYAQYLHELNASGFRLFGENFFLLNEETKHYLVKQHTGMNFEEAASYKDSWYQTIFGTNNEVSKKFIDSILQDTTNQAIDDFISLSKAGKIHKAKLLLDTTPELQRFQELHTDIVNLLKRDNIPSQYIATKLVPVDKDSIPTSAHQALSSAVSTKPYLSDNTSEVDRLIYNYEKHARAIADSGLDDASIARRQEAIEDIKRNGLITTIKEYSVSKETEALLSHYGIDSAQYKKMHGHQLQHALHQEHLEQLELITALTNGDIKEYQESLVKLNCASHLYNQLGQVEKAFAIKDFNQFMLRCMFAIAKGTFKGVKAGVTAVLNDPAGIAIELLAAEHVALFHVARTLFYTARFGYTIASSSQPLRAQWQAFIAPINQILDTISNDPHWVETLLESGTENLIAGLAERNLRSGISSFCKTLKKRTLKVAKNSPDKAQEFGKKKEELEQKVRVTLKTNNMKEFFSDFEFGKKIKDKLEKTKDRFQGQAIYQVKEGVAGYLHLEKGDKLYLDALHKDHFEVYRKNGSFKTVLNLDGTVNEAKKRAASNSRRSI